ncbi:hypothetical protein D3C76_1621700 [compost metagenome]
MLVAQVMQDRHARYQAGELLTLVQRPGQPRCNPQILGLGPEHPFSNFLHFQPIGLPALMHGLSFSQLMLQRFEFARKTDVFTCKTLFANSRLRELKIVR